MDGEQGSTRGIGPARGGARNAPRDSTPARSRGIEADEARRRILAAAERLFYAQGIQAVGMDQVRDAAGVSLKRLYQCFASKDALVEAYLEHRDRRWNDALAEHVGRVTEPRERVLAVFGFLAQWFGTADFRGCAFINAFGELGPASPPVATAARTHKRALRERLRALTAEVGAADPEPLADQLLLLLDGAIVAAAMSTAADPAQRAEAAARALLDAATTPSARERG